jgi:hypothetical protein
VGGTCGTQGGGERCLQDFRWDVRREETTGKSRRRLEDNIKMDLTERGIYEGVYKSFRTESITK